MSNQYIDDLFSACRSGELNMIFELINHFKISPNAEREFFGFTPVVWAALHGQTQAAKYLLTSGTLDENAKANHLNAQEHTALMALLNEGSTEKSFDTIEFLLFSDELREKSDLFWKNNKGINAFMIMCEKGHIDLFAYLVMEKQLTLDTEAIAWLKEHEKTIFLNIVQARELYVKINHSLDDKKTGRKNKI